MGNWFGILTMASVLAGRVFAADVVTSTFSPDDGKGNPKPDSRTEVVQVVFEPGEEAVAQQRLKEAISDALFSNPRADIGVICATGGAMTRAGCGALKKDLGPKVPVEESPTLEPPAPAKRKSDWKGVLTFIRTITGGVTSGITAMISKGADWKQALVVGASGGAWSGFMQWKNRDRLNWQAHRHWFSTAPPEEHERGGIVKRYLKRAMQTAAYGTIMSAAFYLTGLNPDLVSAEQGLRLLTMTGESLYTQTAWEALNQEWTEAAIKRRPEKAHVYRRISGIASLVQSTINVVANALNIGGVHIGGVHVGTVISGTVGTAGALTYAARWVPDRVRKFLSCLWPFGLLRR